MALWTDERVGLVEQRRKVPVEQPSLLYKLELPRDVGVEAHEQQAALLTVRGSIPRHRSTVLATAAQDTVIVGSIQQRLGGSFVWGETVARIGPAHVRPRRAPVTVRIAAGEAERVLWLVIFV